MSKQFSYPKHKIKVLLLENINPSAREFLEENGYSIEEVSKALSSDELLEAIEDVHILGIRSKTKVQAQHFERAGKLLAVGCFGVGTNQVDLKAAALKGVPVFNAPYASTRSVAELAVGDIFMLARQAGYVNNMLHQGKWRKSAKGVYEVRGKTLGLIGYGHIGQQVGLLSELVGMHVLYFDMMKRLPLGSARPVGSFEELLSQSDFVSLHVPAQKGGKPLIGRRELGLMKKGSYLLNLSRGSLVDMAALKDALDSGQLGGAALDVFAEEPGANEADFACELMGVKNAVLTPHIGGSTVEAQRAIGIEVAESFINFTDNGVSYGAVNFPQVNLPLFPGEHHRILNVHSNVPGALTEVNRQVAEVGANIHAQFLGTNENVGYIVMDIDKEVSEDLREKISALSASIRTRVLY